METIRNKERLTYLGQHKMAGGYVTSGFPLFSITIYRFMNVDKNKECYLVECSDSRLVNYFNSNGFGKNYTNIMEATKEFDIVWDLDNKLDIENQSLARVKSNKVM